MIKLVLTPSDADLAKSNLAILLQQPGLDLNALYIPRDPTGILSVSNWQWNHVHSSSTIILNLQRIYFIVLFTAFQVCDLNRTIIPTKKKTDKNILTQWLTANCLLWTAFSPKFRLEIFINSSPKMFFQLASTQNADTRFRLFEQIQYNTYLNNWTNTDQYKTWHYFQSTQHRKYSKTNIYTTITHTIIPI